MPYPTNFANNTAIDGELNPKASYFVVTFEWAESVFYKHAQV